MCFRKDIIVKKRGVEMARTAAIGEQDFRKMIENQYFYVDKTSFIKEWWENGDTVTLITRPRRFGKTLTMDMLECFFSIQDTGQGSLFADLCIWKEEKYRRIQGTYPVISLSFAGVKGSQYRIVRKKICQLLVNLYEKHRYLLDSGFLKGESAAFFQRVSVNIDDADASLSMGQLSQYLYSYYQKKVIILLDEYDTPMQEAYVNGYWDELADFMRGLFNFTFKTNPFLERAVMTGVTRISKESIFSELNNLIVVTASTRLYETAFGFTEGEVYAALEEYALQDQMPQVKSWYDGFQFGNSNCIYNPWSIINFLKFKELKPYWANTSSNRLVGQLIYKSDKDTKMIMEDLLQGKSFCAQIDEEIIFSDLDMKKSAIWSLLLASGYLKVLRIVKNRRGKKEYEFALTNKEAFFIFDEMVMGWFSNNKLNYSEFSDALISGNIVYMNEYLRTISMETISFFDTGVKPSASRHPENFYHGFVLGLIADLREVYKVTSNRESGTGRYDVMLDPYNPQLDDGIILEFKVFDAKKEKQLDDTVQAALLQIIEKRYAAVLEAKCSKDQIWIYGFAFRGKEVLIDGGCLAHIEGQIHAGTAF